MNSNTDINNSGYIDKQWLAREFIKMDAELPNAVAFEIDILAAIMRDENSATKVFQILKEDMFFEPANQKIFKAMVTLATSVPPAPITRSTVSHQLTKQDDYEYVGFQYLDHIMFQPIRSSINTDYLINEVKDKYISRQFVLRCREDVEAIKDSNDISQIINNHESEILQLFDSNTKTIKCDFQSILNETNKDIEEARQGKEKSRIKTGFTKLDNITGGLQKSDLVILAARPGHGKTALALNIATNIVLHEEVPVAFFSLEMSKMQLMKRIISSHNKTSSNDIINKKITTDNKWNAMKQRMDVIAEKNNFHIYDSSSSISTVFDMRVIARKLKEKDGNKKEIGLIIIDYLQLMETAENLETREREIALISRSLKKLAVEFGIPIIALSQLNRKVEERGEKNPILSDLRESGAIEQDADLILFIHRPELYGTTNFTDGTLAKGLAKVTIAKSRHTQTGDFMLRYESDYTRFDNHDEIPNIPNHYYNEPYDGDNENGNTF